MSDFPGYRCWTLKNLHAVAEIEAGGLAHTGKAGEDAVFLATHQPIQLQRQSNRQAEGALVNEQDLLDDFSRDIGNDPHLIFIVGQSGTGKSHMVKWLGATIGDHPLWHEVYIEKKDTSLQRVIETILEDLHGPQIDLLRQRVKEATAALKTVGEAKSRLLHELAFLLENPPDEGPRMDATCQAIDPQLLAYCRNELHVLLNDTVLREELLGEGGVVERITKLALPGGREQAGDVQEADLYLTEDDLPLQPENLADASAAARNLVKRLATHDQLRATALALLNHHLATAKAQVFTGRGTDLVAVFREVREELARIDRELCLFIEDLVLLHGIDRELSQVLTIGRGADGSLCGLRAVVAVTAGYLESIDTLRTRGVRYSLDLRLGTSEFPVTRARSFVTRYLNAARLGPEELVKARRAGEGDDWVPNRCTEEYCSYVAECHAAFGKSAEGYGYYPFNQQAVDRLVSLASNEEKFDPRNVIREVIREPLDVAEEELPHGAFPSARFAAALDPRRANVTAEVKDDLRRRGDVSAERRIGLLSFWAGGANLIGNVDEGIHRAFDLPPLEAVSEAPPPETPPGGEPVEKPRASPVEAEIENWLNGKRKLSADTARMVRQQVFAAVVGHLQTKPVGLKVTNLGGNRYRVGGVEFGRDRNIRIDAAGGSGVEMELDFEITFDRSAANAVLFKSIAQAHGQRSWAWDEDGLRYATFSGVAAHHAERLLQLAAKSRNFALAPALRTLAVSARLAGEVPATPEALLPAVLRPGSVAGQRSTQWDKLKTAADYARRAALTLLRDELTAAKGTGAASLLDAALLLPALKGLDKLRQLSEPITGTNELVELQRALMDAQRDAARAEWIRVARQLDRLADFLGDEDRWDDLQRTVTAAVDEAQNQGALPQAMARDNLMKSRDAVDPEQLDRLRRLQRNRPTDPSTPPADALWDLVPDPSPGLDILGTYLLEARQVLTAIQRHMGEQSTDDGVGGVGVSAVCQELGRLGDDLDTVAKEG